MNLIAELEKKEAEKKVPQVSVGDIVKVTQEYKEGDKKHTSIFEGRVIKISSGGGSSKTFTLRRVISGVGVEKIYPLYLKDIKIEVLKHSKVRRAKLYYLRRRVGKKARLKEREISNEKPTPKTREKS